MDSKEVICEITFQDPQSFQAHAIIGKVKKKQIFSLNDSWISISNTHRINGEWKNVKDTIHKSNILQLHIYKKKLSYTFEKESLSLYQMIQDNSLMVRIC